MVITLNRPANQVARRCQTSGAAALATTFRTLSKLYPYNGDVTIQTFDGRQAYGRIESRAQAVLRCTSGTRARIDEATGRLRREPA